MEVFDFAAQMAGVALVLSIISLVFFVLFIICIILYIRVTSKGIKALDIYINKNTSRPFTPGPQNYYNNPQQYPNQNPHTPNSLNNQR